MEECDIARQLAAKSLNQQCKAAPVPLQLQRFSVECGAMEPLPDASHTLAKQPTSFVIPGLAKREPANPYSRPWLWIPDSRVPRLPE